MTAPSRLQFTFGVTQNRATVVTIDLLDRDGKTELVLVHEELPNEKEREGHRVGWTEILKQVMGDYERLMTQCGSASGSPCLGSRCGRLRDRPVLREFARGCD